MSKPISAEDYIKTKMSVAIIEGAKNYLEKHEKPGDATRIRENEEYVLEIMKEAHDIVVKNDRLQIIHNEGKVTRNGKEIKSLERTSMEQYLKMRSQIKEKQERD